MVSLLKAEDGQYRFYMIWDNVHIDSFLCARNMKLYFRWEIHILALRAAVYGGF